MLGKERASPSIPDFYVTQCRERFLFLFALCLFSNSSSFTVSKYLTTSAATLTYLSPSMPFSLRDKTLLDVPDMVVTRFQLLPLGGDRNHSYDKRHGVGWLSTVGGLVKRRSIGQGGSWYCNAFRNGEFCRHTV